MMTAGDDGCSSHRQTVVGGAEEQTEAHVRRVPAQVLPQQHHRAAPAPGGLEQEGEEVSRVGELMGEGLGRPEDDR